MVTQSSSSRLFDGGVVVLGGLLAAGAVGALIAEPSRLQPTAFLCVPLIMVMGWFPLLIGRIGGGIEVGLDACVLVFLAITVSPFEALVVWALGVSLGQALTDKRVSTRVFNSGLGVVAGGLALLVLDLVRSGAQSTPRELVATGLGVLVYFVVDFTVSAVSLSLDEGTRLLPELALTGTLTAMAAFVAIASLGYLAALVVDGLPKWSAALLAVPVATILWASRAQSRGSEHARRLKVLFETAVEVQAVDDRPALLEALRSGASRLLHDPRVTLRQARPGSQEIGVKVKGSEDDLWMVGPALNRVRSDAAQDQQGLEALVAVAEDALARLRLTEAMTHLAWHDSLTGLSNRSLFMDRVEHAMDMQGRRGGSLAVLFCDLDGFKRVNDRFGHAAGDELLIEVAKRIKASVRVADTVSRLGGDEFAVLLEDLSDPAEVSLACRRILHALRSGMEVSGEDVSVTITIGVAMSQPGGSVDALLSQADLAMYHAKSQGKNRFETYRLSFGDERLQRIELVETLRRAVEARQLEVEYQPVVDLRDHRILGVEALVRWRRPDGVLVPPDLFIPTAEESGLIVGLGDIVLDLVATDVPLLRAAAGARISVSVNVSTLQLVDDDFADRVLGARAAMGDVDLILEVTERDFARNDARVLASMTALTAAGVRFAVDDFGVGFSSIGYLQRLPVQILKVDRSFLVGIEEDSRACSLLGSVVVMGEALGLEVVIEGIERDSQLKRLLRDAGATLGQGFLFGRPVPCDEMTALLVLQQAAAEPTPIRAVAAGSTAGTAR